MIVKVEKTYYTFDVKYFDGRKGSADFGNHIYYLISNKQTGLYDPDRCDMQVKLNPMLADFGIDLEMIGADLDKDQLKALCFDQASQQKEYFNRYTKNSPKRKFLDENGECYDKTKLFSNKCNFTFEREELDRILDDFNGNELQAKLMIQEIKNEWFAIYYNDIKKSQNIKGRKTKASDIESLDDFHLKHANPHIHSYTHAYDPVSGRYMNPRFFSLAKQAAHLKIEKKYKQYLNPVALGYECIEGYAARKTYIAECVEKGFTQRQTIDSYKEIQNNVKAIVGDSSLSLEQAKLKFMECGLEVIKLNEKSINLSIKGSEAVFNLESFMNKETRRLLKGFMARSKFDGNEKVDFKTRHLEEVLQANFTATEKALNEELNQLKKNYPDATEDQIKAVKLKAFYQLAETNRTSGGIFTELNKQGHCKYWRMDQNDFKSGKNVTLTPYKSSMLTSRDLLGSNLVNFFGLSPEEIQDFEDEHLKEVPNTIKYRKKVYMEGTIEDVNLLNDQLYFNKQLKYAMEFRGGSLVDKDNSTIYRNKKNQAILEIDKANGKITSSSRYAKEAATVYHLASIEAVKSYKKNEFLLVEPDEHTNYKFLRELQVKLLFSTDKNSKKIKVKYPDMENDPILKQMIQEELDKQFDRFDTNFKKNSKKIKKGVFNFNDNSGMAILNNPKMEEFQDQIKAKLNSQILELITVHDAKEIQFNKKVDAKYLAENKDEILAMAANLPEKEKAKVHAFYEKEAIETGNQDPKNKAKNKKKVKIK